MAILGPSVLKMHSPDLPDTIGSMKAMTELVDSTSSQPLVLINMGRKGRSSRVRRSMAFLNKRLMMLVVEATLGEYLMKVSQEAGTFRI